MKILALAMNFLVCSIHVLFILILTQNIIYLIFNLRPNIGNGDWWLLIDNFNLADFDRGIGCVQARSTDTET
jgi:hypothetical protein